MDEIGDVSLGDRVLISTSECDFWVICESEPHRHVPPTKHSRGLEEGEFHRSFRATDSVVNELDLVMPDASSRSWTDGGDWGRPTVEFGEEWIGDVDGPDDLGNTPPNEAVGGEKREVESVRVMDAEMWRSRQAAKSEADSLRSKSMRRVIYMDAVVDYVASEGKGDVWAEYSTESDEQSVSGFVEWLEVEDLRELWGEFGEEMFDDEELFSVEDRALADTLSALRYFHDS